MPAVQLPAYLNDVQINLRASWFSLYNGYMPQTINVLFLAAEAEPFVKVGGLGDVAGTLPRALRALSNDEIKLKSEEVIHPIETSLKGKLENK